MSPLPPLTTDEVAELADRIARKEVYIARSDADLGIGGAFGTLLSLMALTADGEPAIPPNAATCWEEEAKAGARGMFFSCHWVPQESMDDLIAAIKQAESQLQAN